MLYIISHKETKKPDNPYYSILAVGNNKSGSWYDKSDEDVRDGINEQISQKNPYYCELTGLYWLFKHCTDDIVGVCHYRRYFTKDKRWKPDLSTILSEHDVESILESNDIILPSFHSFRYPVYHYTLRIYGEHEDLIFNELRNSIKRNYPEYVSYFDDVSSSYQSYVWNMLICKKELFDAYCEWLFTILFDMENLLEKKLNFSKLNREQKRLYGYLSEKLITVWTRKNNLKIYESPIIFTEEDRSVKGQVQKWLHYHAYFIYKFKIFRTFNNLYDRTGFHNKVL